MLLADSRKESLEEERMHRRSEGWENSVQLLNEGGVTRFEALCS